MFQVSAIIRCPVSRGAEQASSQLCNLQILNLKSQDGQKLEGLGKGDALSADTEAALTKTCIKSGQRHRVTARFELQLKWSDFWICREQPCRKCNALGCHRAGSFPPGQRVTPRKSEKVHGQQ